MLASVLSTITFGSIISIGLQVDILQVWLLYPAASGSQTSPSEIIQSPQYLNSRLRHSLSWSLKFLKPTLVYFFICPFLFLTSEICL